MKTIRAWSISVFNHFVLCCVCWTWSQEVPCRTTLHVNRSSFEAPFSVKMILDAISLVDCLVFVIFLTPQLFIQAGPIATLGLFFQITPFLGKQPLLQSTFSSKLLSDTPFSTHPSADLGPRAISHSFRQTITLCPKCHSFPGHCDPLCTLCLWANRCEHWSSLLFQTRGLPFPAVSHVAERVFELAIWSL